MIGERPVLFQYGRPVPVSPHARSQSPQADHLARRRVGFCSRPLRGRPITYHLVESSTPPLGSSKYRTFGTSSRDLRPLTARSGTKSGFTCPRGRKHQDSPRLSRSRRRGHGLRQRGPGRLPPRGVYALCARRDGVDPPGEEKRGDRAAAPREWGSTERNLLPPGDHDWWLYGGLFRSVYLEIVPELSVARILVGHRRDVMESVVVVHNEGGPSGGSVVRFDPGWEDGS